MLKFVFVFFQILNGKFCYYYFEGPRKESAMELIAKHIMKNLLNGVVFGL